jgi:hypothetical protein
MPLTDPTAYRDKTEDLMAVFHAERREMVRRLLRPGLLDLDQVKDRPETIEHHADMHLVLNYLRTLPIVGKSFVFAEEPYQHYRVGLVTGPGEPAEILEERYDDERAALDAVLLHRLRSIGIDSPEAVR